MSFLLANLENISKIISTPTWDILMIFFFLAMGFFYGISAGKNRLFASLFSIYIAILLFANFHYLDFFVAGKKIFDIFIFRAICFFVLIVLLNILFTKTIFHGARKHSAKWWQAFTLSFLEVGLFMSALFQLLPVKELFNFSPIVTTLFASDQSFFWWLTLPIIALFFIVRNHKDI